MLKPQHLSGMLALLVLPAVLRSSSAQELVPNSIADILSKQCFDCHGNGASEGGLKLDGLLQQTTTEETKQRWWKVLSNVRAGTMPPPDSDSRLSQPELQNISNWIKYKAFEIDRNQPDPGRVTLRRLNRREYANTIRDLLGIDFNADIVFPPDDTGFGFDNVGDALSLSPMVVEKFLAAASQIVNEAVPKTNWVMPELKYRATDFRGESGNNADNMRMNRSHQVQRKVDIEKRGQYSIAFVMKSGGSFEFSPQRCLAVCSLDGNELFRSEYGWNESKRHYYTFEQTLAPGEHRIEFDVTPIATTEKGGEGFFADLDVESLVISGPADRSQWQHPKGYERVFTRPESPADEDGRRAYAQEIFRSFGLRAFRRPIEESAVNRLVSIAQEFCQQPGATFEAGIAHAIVPMLASPRFLFRFEEPMPVAEGERFPRVDEYALASRLSYFLWSSMPDTELFELAKQGKLRAQLDEQIARMLRDKRSKSLVQNFVGQWLRTRDVEKTSIDPLAVYGLQAEFDELLATFRRGRFGRRPPQPSDTPPDPEADKRRARFQELRTVQGMWDADVRTAMRRETEMLFEYIAQENRSMLEIIDPGYTFLNEKLAKYYGIPDVHGNEMRKVNLPGDSLRGGILTQGSMLTVTSNPTRTSPVKRGLFLLENILGTPTPPAPPNVPALEDASSKFGGREPTLKELLAAHRESALCSSCHSRMDPLGLALENFDALGVWRDTEKAQPIDASGELITGEKFKDFRDLRRIIATERKQDFYRCVAQKMLVYALGRGIDYYDEYTLDQLVERLSANDGKYQELIYGIIHSSAFQRQRVASSSQNQIASDQ
jgi:mono/diheme cytochrome c family protein